MKIGIDARFVGPSGTGLGKYTEKLIANLVKIDKKNEYRIFLKRENRDYLKLSKNFKKVEANIPWYSVQEQIKMPAIYNRENLDLLHVPHFNVPIFYRKKFVVTIHDLIHHHFAETTATTKNPLTYKIKRLGYKFIFANAVNKSAKIITPSNFVKEELLRHFKISPAKIAVTYEAAEEEYFAGREPTTVNREPTLLYVGNVYPHKNIENLFLALKLLNNWKLEIGSPAKVLTEGGNWKLTIVCPRDVFYKRLQNEIQKNGLKNHVTVLGYLQAQDLKKVFQKSYLYVFPSLIEGFGIPGLNAMASNIPVAASDIPTLKEVYGKAAIYFDPKNPKDIADKIKRVLTDPKTRTDLVAAGKIQVKKYSWEKMARQTLEIYESA